MRRPTRNRLATLAALAAILAAASPAPPVAGAPLTTDPSVAAVAGAAWLAAQVDTAGYVPNAMAQPDPGATLDVALALAGARAEEPTFRRIVAWMAADPDRVVLQAGNDSPAALGELLMVVVAGGGDPRAFGGEDLVARLGATLGAFEAGLFGAADPTYDGAYRQSIALSGLRAAGAPLPGAAVDWLVAQQCHAGAGSVGAWLAYRADPAAACPPPDPNTFTGPDTNSTAAAVMALRAAGRDAPAGSGLAWLHTVQEGDGGFGFVPGGGADPNSTALVVMAAIAGGEDPRGVAWTVAGTSAVASLLTWQVGPPADAADQGGFASPFSNGFPDLFASRQAVWGAALITFPLPADVYAAAPVPPPSSTTSSSTTSSSTTTTPTTATASVAAVAQPVGAGAPYAG